MAVWLLVSVFVATSTTAEEKVFRAGAAMSNITPPLGELIVGGWTPIPAKHVHDELYARCLVLDDGTSKLAIVLCDNVGIPREVFDEARKKIEAAGEIPGNHILMASTHTHSATTARGPSKVIWEDELTEYQQFLANRIADGVSRAINLLQPAQIGWGSVDEPSEVFNRRWHVTDPSMLTNPFGGVDKVRMNPSRGSGALVKPAGPIDPEVSFISVRSVSGQPIALLANYSLHYVGGVKSGDISGDYFGYFAKFIGDKLVSAEADGVPFVGIMSNGTSGDINNINFQEKGSSYKSYEKMQEVAQKVADRVYEAHQAVKFHDWVSLQAASSDLELTVRKPTEEMKAHFAALEKDPDSKGHIREKIYAERIGRLKDAPDTIQVPLQVFRIGELGIAAVPFETFVEIGLELKDRHPFKDFFTIELANGSYGYLPTPEQHELGGYETWLGTNFVEFQASRKITDRLLELANSIRN
ncbi:MAG: hypothetical protein KDA81_21310 [Planctomycetaceae bacterium]|nr:hypothetical protein [Planctomycetaceae bacterium]